RPAAAQAAPDAEPEPVAATPLEPVADPRKGRAEPAETETAEEPELEPAFATAVEVAPAPAESGKIRFAEEVLRRRPEQDEKGKQKKRRRPRYVETDEGLDEDPYADYEDDF
ncbi:MAG: hypothetical protein OXG38_08055, partial [Chloroflexi bacterium]|nr:hypothetical protein [Chloroflexota bacterium]